MGLMAARGRARRRVLSLSSNARVEMAQAHRSAKERGATGDANKKEMLICKCMKRHRGGAAATRF